MTDVEDIKKGYVHQFEDADGNPVFPVTVTDAVVDPKSGKTIEVTLDEEIEKVEQEFQNNEGAPSDLPDPEGSRWARFNEYERLRGDGLKYKEDLFIDSDNEVKLADRDNTDGMGYIILRKNKSFAEQVTKENTVYEIRYDFDLNEEEVTIPYNCILFFVGGSLNNGTVKGDNTVIDSARYNILNVNLIGSWNSEFKIDWFGRITKENDCSTILQKALDSIPANSILLFNPNNIIKFSQGVSINKNGIIVKYGNFDTTKSVSAFSIVNCENIVIDSCKFNGGGQIIRLFTCNNIKVCNCYFENTYYSIIQEIRYTSNNVHINKNTIKNATGDFVECNCEFLNQSENWIVSENIYLGSKEYPISKTECRFIGITYVNNVIISNNIIKNVSGDAVVHVEGVGTVLIEGNTIEECSGTGFIYTMKASTIVKVINNTFKTSKRAVLWHAGNSDTNKLFKNNYVEGDFIFYVGDCSNTVIDSNYFKGIEGIDLNHVYGITISNNIFKNMLSPIGCSLNDWKSLPNAGSAIYNIIGNNFSNTVSDLCVCHPCNLNGVGQSLYAMIMNNVFDKGIYGSASNSNRQDIKPAYIAFNVLTKGATIRYFDANIQYNVLGDK